MASHAEAIAGTLAECGVEHVFGLPGGEVLALIDACRRRDLRFVLAGHESSAAVMAQVMGQIKGVPGVCVSTLGPGATNLVTGVANAFLDRAPLLVFTAQIPDGVFSTRATSGCRWNGFSRLSPSAPLPSERRTAGRSPSAACGWHRPLVRDRFTWRCQATWPSRNA